MAADTFRNIVRNAVEEQLRTRLAMLEGLAAEFIKETGLKAEECALVQQHKNDGTTEWYFRRKTPAPQAS
ncbi:MAG: hypothetical protein AB7F89_14210 [Pirellulaceae bacterium]